MLFHKPNCSGSFSRQCLVLVGGVLPYQPEYNAIHSSQSGKGILSDRYTVLQRVDLAANIWMLGLLSCIRNRGSHVPSLGLSLCFQASSVISSQSLVIVLDNESTADGSCLIS